MEFYDGRTNVFLGYLQIKKKKMEFFSCHLWSNYIVLWHFADHLKNCPFEKEMTAKWIAFFFASNICIATAARTTMKKQIVHRWNPSHNDGIVLYNYLKLVPAKDASSSLNSESAFIHGTHLFIWSFWSFWKENYFNSQPRSLWKAKIKILVRQQSFDDAKIWDELT